jgi:DNA polymerase (family X)
MKNKEIANIFREIATMLILKGANPFRVRAYERAANTLENTEESLEVLAASNSLTDLAGVGKDLSEKIKEYLDNGVISYFDELTSQTPAGLLDMLRIQGLGPKTVKRIHDELGIDTISELEDYARKGKLKALEGIKEKTESNILLSIELLNKTAESTPLYIAEDISLNIIDYLSKIKEVKKIAVAGSLRRKKADIKDIDILVSSQNADSVMEAFVAMPAVMHVIAHGATKSSVILDQANMQVDLRVVEAKSFAAALMYFTGSKEFNVRLRSLANKSNYKINEYGVFSESEKKVKKPPALKTETDIFSFFSMAYIEPELREDRGEIEAALKNSLPQLIKQEDIKGDLHVHTSYSDGVNSIEEMAKAAQSLGYAYIGVADHSQSLRIANGLSVKELHKKIEEVKKINSRIKGIEILCAAEVDILSDGELDYPDSVLKELDCVIGAIHSSFKQTEAQLTSRIVKACTNKHVNIIAHPTGILLGSRGAYTIDFNEVFKAANEYNVALEINSHPHRLDLNEVNTRRGKNNGVKLCINTDSHDLSHFDLIKHGINIARRGWIEKKDVVNCLNLKSLLKWLDK